jgi:glycine cleavage system transcriptional repressor
MERHAVLTTIGDDRTGLVDEVTRFVAECGGNLEDSRMVNLHGQFAMVMLVEGSPETIECLRARLPELAEASRLHAQITPADLGPRAAAPAVPFRLTTAAMDHPGLVQSVSHLMREHGVNIESVDTTLRQAPITGAPLFEMEMVVSVPAATPVAGLREAVAALCDDLNMDWQLTAL